MVSTHVVVAGSIPAFSTCLFHILVPRVPGGAADKKTGPLVLYRRIEPVLMCPFICNEYLDGRYQAPFYLTLTKFMDFSFPPLLAGGQLLTKEIEVEKNSVNVIPHSSHDCEPV